MRRTPLFAFLARDGASSWGPLSGGYRLLSAPHLWLLHWTLTAAVKVTVNTPSVQVARGGSAFLPCSFRTTAALNRLNIIWTVSPLQDPQRPLQVIAYEQGQIVESLSEYLGRAQFAFQPTKDASLFINQTRSSDTGTYQCTVINPPDTATPNIGLVGLTVLVPPSKPECSSEGWEAEGGSIRLHCSVQEGVPAPRFKWERIPDGQVLATSQADYFASVALNNVTRGTSGLYRCTATNQLGSQSCAVELHVQVAVLGTMGIVASVAITLVMGLVLLALFALVLILHQQSRGKWREQADDACDWVRAGDPSPQILHAAKYPDSDANPSSRGLKPIWLLTSQAGQLPTHVLYDVRHSRLSLAAASETPALGLSRYRTQDSFSESDEEESWGRSPVLSSPDAAPVLRSSMYSTNSGFLV
ncbi:immunoglobulin superfamily member 11-like [Spea bombifrons]|uniref:immunoglobulin superfamily member 11-like n=1 Tax=Spea bombifrons TaxID=233779 RepID=UPI00234B3763|nr:immunoglobulin superfamily member 11-like [Spea bombifrons]